MNIARTRSSPGPSRHRTCTPPPTAEDIRIASEFIGPERRRSLIAQAAYFRAKHRGFEPGHELDDWLAAEAEVDTALTIGVHE